MRLHLRQRLRQQRSFDAIKENSRKFTAKAFIMRLHYRNLSHEKDPLPRFGVIASRRIGNAVVRNRAKRLLREVFRREQVYVKPNCDILIIVRKAFFDCSFDSLVQAFQKAYRQLGHDPK